MRRISAVLLMSSFFITLQADKRVCTLIIPHSPSVNAARELAGWENQVNILDTDATHGSFAITPEITLAFRPERVAQCFFGDAILECDSTFTLSGSQSPNRIDAHWLADYFGLPTDFESCVYVRPKVSQALLDLDLHVGFHKYVPGLYFRIHAPIVYTNWDLRLCETLITTGSNAHDPGYFNATGIPRIQLVDNFTSFISGTDAPKASGLTFHKLEHAKMNCQAEHLTKLSDIQIAIGYNILQKKRYHLGGTIRFSIPTGNSPTGQFLFEPIVGNSHHWELGGGLSTHIIVWENEDTQEHAGLYFDMNITHMFTSDQQRSFDLCGSHNSRYMLAQKMSNTIQDSLRGIVDGERIEPTAQYNLEVTTVANLTTIPVEVSASVQADLALMVGYQKEQNSWGFGYGFWGRSCETITLCPLIPFETASWALKGDTQLFGFADNILNTPVPLSATQSKATVNRGKNFPQTGAATVAQIAEGKKNPNIDNPAPAVADADGDTVFESLHTTPGGTDQINTSIQPVILSRDDIDINSARTRGRSHKIFSHFNHIIKLQNSTPYIGFGAEVEFGQSAFCERAVSAGDPPCVNTALSFWGVWLKGGVAF